MKLPDFVQVENPFMAGQTFLIPSRMEYARFNLESRVPLKIRIAQGLPHEEEIAIYKVVHIANTIGPASVYHRTELERVVK